MRDLWYLTKKMHCNRWLMKYIHICSLFDVIQFSVFFKQRVTILLRVLLALVVRKGLEWQCCEITTPWMSPLLDRAPVEAIAKYGGGASSNFGNRPYFWSRRCARPSLGEQNVTLAVNICFDIGASFDPKNIEGKSGEWYYDKIVSNRSNSWCDNHIGMWEYERYRFAKLQEAHPPFAYLADNPWQMAPKSHWQQDCQETINHPPKVWAAKIIWYTAVWIQWWSVKPIELWPLASVFVERPCKWVIFHNLWASSGCEPVTCNLVFVFYASLCWRWSNSSIAPTRAISMHWIDLSRQNFSSLLCITPEVQDVTTSKIKGSKR